MPRSVRWVNEELQRRCCVLRDCSRRGRDTAHLHARYSLEAVAAFAMVCMCAMHARARRGTATSARLLLLLLREDSLQRQVGYHAIPATALAQRPEGRTTRRRDVGPKDWATGCVGLDIIIKHK